MVTPDNIIMPSRKPRVALTIPDDIHSVLDRMSELTGVPKTKLIVDMLEQYLPIFQKTIIALEQIQADKEKAPDIAKKFAQDLIFDGHELLGQVAKRGS